MAAAIKVEHLSKAYQLGEIGTGTISRDLERFWAKLRGRDDPFLKIGEVNDRTVKGTSNVVWSLRDISFGIEQGMAVGIIGRNGAGKSTLLKILSRVTAPTTGAVKIKGRIASLLEVGTGFHPELSGRENIYLNGAILGMRKGEIKRKFDEIVDFSGVGRYVDTPVKRYSSGMYVRLAFAVAAHLESEIMIVDEVLAVGDAEFQKKCIGKMNEVSKREGKTVLFVSHNMNAIQKLCTQAIVMHQGSIKTIGETNQVISSYLQNEEFSKSVYDFAPPEDSGELPGFFTRIRVEDTNDNPLNEIPAGKPWQIRVLFQINRDTEHFIIAAGLSNAMEVNVRTSWSYPADLKAGAYQAVFKEQDLILAPGCYNFTIGLSAKERAFQYMENAAALVIAEATDPGIDGSIIRINNVGLILNPMEITISSL